MGNQRTSVGLDESRSVMPVAGDEDKGEVARRRLAPSFEDIGAWLGKLPGPVAVVYEAGPTGLGLYRNLTAQDISCVVAALSQLQRPAGDKVKTDANGAMHLARLLRLGEVTPVAVPTFEQETARDLVRTRHRVSKLLLRSRELLM